jgi:hypothetical protein
MSDSGAGAGWRCSRGGANGFAGDRRFWSGFEHLQDIRVRLEWKSVRLTHILRPRKWFAQSRAETRSRWLTQSYPQTIDANFARFNDKPSIVDGQPIRRPYEPALSCRAQSSPSERRRPSNPADSTLTCASVRRNKTVEVTERDVLIESDGAEWRT